MRKRTSVGYAPNTPGPSASVAERHCRDTIGTYGNGHSVIVQESANPRDGHVLILLDRFAENDSLILCRDVTTGEAAVPMPASTPVVAASRITVADEAAGAARRDVQVTLTGPVLRDLMQSIFAAVDREQDVAVLRLSVRGGKIATKVNEGIWSPHYEAAGR